MRSVQAAIDGVVYMNHGDGGKKDLHRARQIKGVCGKFTRALCAWDSGSVNVLESDLLTHTLAGTQFPAFTWRKYHLHRPKS